MSKLVPVHYVVTDTFGKAEVGDVRLAFLVGGRQNGEPALLYHPPLRGECASVEICQRHPYDRFLGKPLFYSLDGASYINLTSVQARAYEGMLIEAGLEVPSNPVVTQTASDSPLITALAPPPRPHRPRSPR